MDLTETTRLAAAINALRPDWPHASLVTFLTRDLSDRAYRDVAVALTWVACDPATQTPRRVLEAGPWWDAVAAGVGLAPATPTNSTLDGRCPKCGMWTVRSESHQCAPLADPALVQEAIEASKKAIAASKEALAAARTAHTPTKETP